MEGIPLLICLLKDRDFVCKLQTQKIDSSANMRQLSVLPEAECCFSGAPPSYVPVLDAMYTVKLEDPRGDRQEPRVDALEQRQGSVALCPEGAGGALTREASRPSSTLLWCRGQGSQAHWAGLLQSMGRGRACSMREVLQEKLVLKASVSILCLHSGRMNIHSALCPLGRDITMENPFYFCTGHTLSLDSLFLKGVQAPGESLRTALWDHLTKLRVLRQCHLPFHACRAASDA